MSELGKFRIVVRIRLDNPAFPQYLVYLGPNLIGKQFSVPTLSDCEWLERQRSEELVYAESSAKMSEERRARMLRGLDKGRAASITAKRYRISTQHVQITFTEEEIT